MCLVTFLKDSHPDYPFILLANRDEEYSRPAAPVHRWTKYPYVTAGMDLKEFGTWLGYTDEGKFITILNYPFVNWTPTVKPPRSRGQLLKDYLTGDYSIEAFTLYLKANREMYNGYHLLYGTFEDLRYYSNVDDNFLTFSEGIYSLANTTDDLSNHRTDRAAVLLEKYIEENKMQIKLEELTNLLADQEIAAEMTNYPSLLKREEALSHSSIFIKGPEFGTVGTTAILLHKDGTIQLREVKYNQEGITEITEKVQKIKY